MNHTKQRINAHSLQAWRDLSTSAPCKQVAATCIVGRLAQAEHDGVLVQCTAIRCRLWVLHHHRRQDQQQGCCRLQAAHSPHVRAVQPAATASDRMVRAERWRRRGAGQHPGLEGASRPAAPLTNNLPRLLSRAPPQAAGLWPGALAAPFLAAREGLPRLHGRQTADIERQTA